MSPFKWLNNLLFLENIFGIYRMYGIQKNRKKCFIMFQIFIQTVFYTVTVGFVVYLFLGRNDINQMKIIFACFCVIAYINSLTSIVTGICYSSAFMSYLRSINSVYRFIFEYFKDDKTLISSIKKIVFTSISFILFTFLFSAYRSVEALISYLPSDSSPIWVPLMLSQAVIRITAVFQHLMLYVVIMIVVLLIKCLNSLISAVQEKVESCNINSDEQCDITGEQIQRWVELYRELVNCCEKVTLCFGRQYFYSLVMSVSQYVLVAYQVLYSCLSKAEFIHDVAKIIVVLLSYMIVMVMPLVAGQLTRNHGVKLHRVLARLYNTMIIGSGEAEAKLVKDFMRVLKNNPLEIKLSIKIPVGMYMLPIIFTLAINYLIVMLQFNHVI